MFYGSVPAEAQAIMNKIVKAWDVTDIYVGCSGNFTLEKFIGPLGQVPAAQQRCDHVLPVPGRTLPAGTRPPGAVRGGGGSVPMASGLYEDRRGPDRHHAAVLRHRGLYRQGRQPVLQDDAGGEHRQFPAMHEKTVQKVSANTLTISSYYNGDAMDFVKEAPADARLHLISALQEGGQGVREGLRQAGEDVQVHAAGVWLLR